MKDKREISNLYRVAIKKDPEKLACYIYHIMKSNPDSGFVNDREKCLSYLKRILLRHYGWELSNIDSCYQKLRILAKYFFLDSSKS